MLQNSASEKSAGNSESARGVESARSGLGTSASAETNEAAHEVGAGGSGPDQAAAASAASTHEDKQMAGLSPSTPATEGPETASPQAWQKLRRGTLSVGAAMFLANTSSSKASKALAAQGPSVETEAAITKMQAWEKASARRFVLRCPVLITLRALFPARSRLFVLRWPAPMALSFVTNPLSRHTILCKCAGLTAFQRH